MPLALRDHFGGRRVQARERLLEWAAIVSLTLATPYGVVGFVNDDVIALALSSLLLGSGLVLLDLAKSRSGAISPITFYSLSWTLTSLGNLAAVLNQDSTYRPVFWLYALDEHLLQALKLSLLGLLVPVLGFRWVRRSATWHAILGMLPRVIGHVPPHRLLWLCVFASATTLTLRVLGSVPELGTITAVVFVLPLLCVFVLARVGTMRNWPVAVWMAFAIAIAEAVRALWFAYLRSEIIAPVFAYCAGALLGSRSVSVLRSKYMIPAYMIAVPFMVFFAAFGEVRSQYQAGIERIGALAQSRAVESSEDVPSSYSLLARFSTINQLTQVVRVVEEDGHLYGGTLEYLAYAWIPRFIWRDKPTIAKGSWFALRIGQARIHQGRITNSINMTVPGELFLNFGWLGVIFGGLVFGGLLAALWGTTGFWSYADNTLGAAFGFYMIWVGMTGAADLQIIVTLVAMYGLFAVASFAFPPIPSTAPLHSSKATATATHSDVMRATY